MADSLQLDVAAVLNITKKSEVNISGIATNSHELVNEQQHKYLCDKNERSETHKLNNIPPKTNNSAASKISTITLSPLSPLSSSSSSSLPSSLLMVSTATSTSSSAAAATAITPIANTITSSSGNQNKCNNIRKIETSVTKKTVQHVGLVSTTTDFNQHHFQSHQQQTKNLLFQKPQAMESHDEDLRKKRCTDRYDSSESSDR